jgi:2-C-methyl-D-erythritol 4-phosphate cytidylyltransferase
MTGAGRVAALVLGAGRGERLGHALPKAFVPVAGESLIERSIRALAESRVIDLIQPVLAAAEFERFEALGIGASVPSLTGPVEGGRERQDSMRAGLEALPPEIEFVAVHDAARCLVAPEDLVAVVEAASQSGAAILGERSRDTIKRVVNGEIVETPERRECWAAQTPQVIRKDWLEAAVEAAVAAGRQATDDAQLVEWAGHSVTMVESTAPNPKMTRPEDLLLAESLLADQRRAKGQAI